MIIYLDTNLVIYSVENPAGYGPRAIARIAVARAAGDTFALSDLTRLECRVKPLKLGDTVLLADYENFFSASDVTKVPLTTAVYDRATDIRATLNFKTADALHLAAAVESGCHVFLTNDTRLSRYADIAVEVLS